MADIKDIIQNIEQIYGSNNSLNLLKDFERVLDELDMYVYDNWIDGELVSGPYEKRYFVECTFMWPYDKMPDPTAGTRLIDYGCKVEFAESKIASVRKIKKPEDIRAGTRKGKIDYSPIWSVRITIPKKLMNDINRGYRNLDQNKVADIVNQQTIQASSKDSTEQKIQDITDEELPTDI
jgi:hypothetical protein